MFSLNKIKLSRTHLANAKQDCFKISFKKSFIPSNRNASSICSYDELVKDLTTKIEKEREKVAKFKKEYGKVKVGDITVAQLYGGMRGLVSAICDTSQLDAQEGIRFRGYTIKDIKQQMPKVECGEEPLPEGMFLLLLTSDMPCEESVKFLSETWARNSQIPPYAERIINSFSRDLHPMTQLSMAVCSLNKESKFKKAYDKNVPRTEYWKYVLEDSMDLLAKLPTVAAMIYNNTFKDGKGCYETDPSLDWSANYAKMLGFDQHDFNELMRLYLTLHCDHEGGNVSAHACHLVGSALSDPYLSFSAGLNGLAGPLHGRANEEVLIWLDKLIKAKGIAASEQDIKNFCHDKEKQHCRLIPGYGHAVLRKTDPRFLSLMAFAQRTIPDDPMVKLVATCYKAVPKILKALGKVNNPWPNVDAHSGVLLRHFGLNQVNYYTVLFGISRALGTMAQLVWDRALLMPIERPATIATDLLLKKLAKKLKE